MLAARSEGGVRLLEMGLAPLVPTQCPQQQQAQTRWLIPQGPAKGPCTAQAQGDEAAGTHNSLSSKEQTGTGQS